MLEGEGFAGSSHRNCVNAKAWKIQVLSQPAPKNRQRRVRRALLRSMDANGCPKSSLLRVLTSAKNQFVLGVNGDQVELTADLFVFQSGRRAPIPLQNPVAIRLQDAGGQSSPHLPTLWARGGVRWIRSLLGAFWVVAWAVIRAVVMGLSR